VDVGEVKAIVVGGTGPKSGTQPRQQFLERKRLDQIVISTCVETGNTVCDVVAGGEHQHRRLVPLRSDPSTDTEPIGIGHRNVEQQQIGGGFGVQFEGTSTITRSDHVVPFEGESPLE